MLNALSNADQVRLSRLGALSVCAIAGTVCIWTLAKLVWLALPQSSDEIAVTPSAPAPASTASMSIAKWHLFGNPQNPALAHAVGASATTLKLTLRGTLSLTDAKQGMAMIADEHGGESAYKIGDAISDNVKLAEVYADHVILMHEGVPETLTLPRPEEHAPVVDPSTSRVASKSAANSSGIASSIPPGYVPPQMANGAVDFNKAQKNLQIDPTQLAKQVHIEPVFENGKIAGARLSGAGDVGALMSKAGLRPSDVVTSINGTALTSLSDPQAFVDNLKSTSSLQVTVLRDGKPATLTVSLR
jgi:general secretion pathway protein C